VSGSVRCRGGHRARLDGVDTFSAVTTTGIYCVPTCSGRPLPTHVRPFELAAAAEAAGFRPCHRCRPYRTAAVVDWSGPALVCRAVQLVLAGALDGATEDALGARLGVSGRHLRRLFAAHLGVTPDQLARSRRAHFARRLMDDTDLSFTQIAYASGFGSVRQLNRACQDIFRAAPNELRARRRRHDRLAADGGLALRLPFRGPLDWPALLGYFAARAIPGVEHVDGDTYRRTIAIDGDPGVLELAPGGDDHLLLRAHLPHWEGLIHVADRARRIFGLDADIDAANRALGADPAVGELVARRPGLRPPGTWDPFEIGVRAIVGQQVSVAGATTVTGRIVARHGTPVPGLTAFGLTHTFPSPECLAVADLDGLGLTGARIGAIHAFAGAVAKDEVRLDGSLGLDELVRSIAAVPGLGSWTANYLALRIGERDAFPAADLGLQRALARPERPSTTALAGMADAWRPWRAVAAVHLWLA
jgi:AraC family transcriptional regulator of adaptative response / DNA-3-methyladenine glycosylase II